jgi:hypothetical protein
MFVQGLFVVIPTTIWAKITASRMASGAIVVKNTTKNMIKINRE